MNFRLSRNAYVIKSEVKEVYQYVGLNYRDVKKGVLKSVKSVKNEKSAKRYKKDTTTPPTTNKQIKKI